MIHPLPQTGNSHCKTRKYEKIYRLDRYRLGDTAGRINTLALAYYLTDNENYAKKATELLRCRFIDKATRMNPNLEYADETVRNLTHCYRIPVGEKQGFLLDHSTGNHPAGSEIDVPLNYADYYYIESLLSQ